MATEKVTDIPKLLKDATNRQYLPDGQLGSGGFATCFRASMVDRRTTPESQYCALKAVKAAVPKNLIQRFRLELAIQSKLHHPHVVELYRAFTYQDVTYVALELCPNGSLTDMMKRRKYLTMGEIRRMTIQVCGAVKYLHDRDIVHRDIKAGNIFLDENMNVKLGDFGLAAIMEPSPKSAGTDASTLQHIRRTTFCGTPNYLAPEILSRGEGHGTSVDIWAIGVLAYYLSVGRAPFHSKSKDEIYARLKKGQYSWPELAPEQNEIPEDLRDLVGMLLVEESRRPTPDEIVEHPFFKEGYIPPKLEALCRTRRPRWARVGDESGASAKLAAVPIPKYDSEQKRIYEDLCVSSRVGEPWRAVQETLKDQKPEPSMFLVLAKEVSLKVKLEIPLQEGLVYTGRPSRTTSATGSLSKKRTATVRSTKSKTAPAVQVLEDIAAVDMGLGKPIDQVVAPTSQTHSTEPQPQLPLQLLPQSQLQPQKPQPTLRLHHNPHRQPIPPPQLPDALQFQYQFQVAPTRTKRAIDMQPQPQPQPQSHPSYRPQTQSHPSTLKENRSLSSSEDPESHPEPEQESLRRPPRRTRTVSSKTQSVSVKSKTQNLAADAAAAAIDTRPAPAVVPIAVLRSTASTGNRVRARVAEFESRR